MVKATDEDYKRVQGGRPTIIKEKGLWRIRHGYREDGVTITTHISPEDRGTVMLEDGKEYNVAELWKLEGNPCEQRSREAGGEYKRRR